MAEQHEKDLKILDEIGEQTDIMVCEHDDLPTKGLPIGETGFDKSYTLLV